LGAVVYKQSEGIDTHTSGHGYEEDQKLMLNLVKPKYFVPVHGYQSFLYKHAQTAVGMGFDEKNIVIPKRGEVLDFHNGIVTKSKAIRNTPVLISGSGIGDIGSIVMSERVQLGNNGVMIFSALCNLKDRRIVGQPQLLSKGLTYVPDNPALFEQLSLMATQALNKYLEENERIQAKELMNVIKQRLSAQVKKELNREPMILVFLNYLD
jgi:ribonuclease J